MIKLKSPEEIEMMAHPNRMVAECLALAKEMIAPGVTTAEINAAVEEFIEKQGARPAFKGFQGPVGAPPFPAACCMSVDEQVVHGFPAEKPLVDGEIVSVDIGVELDGWYGDAARTFEVGRSTPDDVKLLVAATLEALEKAVEFARPGAYLSDIGHAVQSYVEQRGLSVVRDLVGHGIGRNLHEEPQVPNYGSPGRGLKLRAGMVIAIEPMINLGTWKVDVLNDGWTVVTRDRRPSAHFEHTVAVTENGPRVLTLDP